MRYDREIPIGTNQRLLIRGNWVGLCRRNILSEDQKWIELEEPVGPGASGEEILEMIRMYVTEEHRLVGAPTIGPFEMTKGYFSRN